MLKMVRGLLVLTLALSATASYADQAAAKKKKGLVEDLSGQGYGMAGCGLGSILFGEKEGMVQIFAATTNNIYSNNTFGMTSGTSNCAPEAGNGDVAVIFVEGNRQALENDIARGNGETLMTFAGLMGCKDSAHVGSTLQKNYRRIFSSSEISNEQVVQSIRETLRSKKETAQACASVG